MHTLVNHIGNSVVRVHSPNGLTSMSPEERQAWFDKAWEAGDPTVKRIVEMVCKINRNILAREGA